MSKPRTLRGLMIRDLRKRLKRERERADEAEFLLDLAEGELEFFYDRQPDMVRRSLGVLH